jgi:A/G-specific adenine glycosylase
VQVDRPLLDQFRSTVWDYYAKNARDLPWRTPEKDGSFDPYKILVSEIMLQQTQVSRVQEKYVEFLSQFPTLESLARSSLGEVIIRWQGLGYNRRAKYLHQTARLITQDYEGNVPKETKQLVLLPGIGTNTAAAIGVYAFNRQLVFIETNIRSVFIHHFFKDTESVPDKDIIFLVQQTLDTEMPREWYWALMDYGTYIKATHGNASRQSKSYTKQSVFDGSSRQIRGKVLKILTTNSMSAKELQYTIHDDRLEDILNDLLREKLIVERENNLSLPQ